jgi:tetratricopeptide (TPR) repeat protein
MTQKKALIIGVSNYAFGGFNALPAASRDVQAMQRVLQHPHLGGFDATDITTLVNPDCQSMRVAMNELFADRRKEDLLVLYFSGHGKTDDTGLLHLIGADANPALLKATTVRSNFVHDLMETCRSKQQVVILDCCFSGAFAKGMAVKGDQVNIPAQLGGEGRVVLTSSSSVQYSFEHKESDLSVYTRCLVEGIESGEADVDSDGWISIRELHDYTAWRVREIVPEMKPELYSAREGFKIFFARAPERDSQDIYRREVDRLVRRGDIVFVPPHWLDPVRARLALPPQPDYRVLPRARALLNVRRTNLGLSTAVAAAIETSTLKPHRNHYHRLQQYQQLFRQEMRREKILSPATREELRRYQHELGLTTIEINKIEQPARPRAFRPPVDLGKLTPLPPKVKTLLALGSVTVAVLGASTMATMNLLPVQLINLLPVKLINSQQTLQPAFKPSEMLGPTSTRLGPNQPVSLPSGFKHSILTPAVKPSLEAEKPTASNDNAKILLTLGRLAATVLSASTVGVFHTRPTQLFSTQPASPPPPSPNQVTPSPNQAVTPDEIPDPTPPPESPNDSSLGNANDFLHQGQHQAEENQWSGTIADLTHAIEQLPPNTPESFAYHQARGDIYLAAQQYDQAIADYTKAIDAKADDASLYKKRGAAYVKLGDRQNLLNAIADYAQAITLQPGDADAYKQQGDIYLSLKDYQHTVDDYQKAAGLYLVQKKTDDYHQTVELIQAVTAAMK